MKNIFCKNCGGIMTIDVSSMSANCRFCGSTYVLDHADTDYYRNFFEQMKECLMGPDDEVERRKRADALWEKAEETVFETSDGKIIKVDHMYNYALEDGSVVYVARRNIAVKFGEKSFIKADDFRRNVSTLDYPSADTRKLGDFFPKVTGGFKLSDGSDLIVISKDMDEYPLRLLGKVGGRHAAWIISRLENLCCVLEFNSLVHPTIGLDTVYVNPYTHQASLRLGFENVVRNNTVISGKPVTTEQNLRLIRDTAAQVLGFEKAGDVKISDDVPKALAEFINGRPRTNAYDDFGYWDEMLIKAFGERRFIKFETGDDKLYGKGE